MGTNVINADFSNGDDQVVYTKKVFQHDRGIYIHVTGLELPEKYQAHFSDDPHSGVSITKVIVGQDILIPDAYLRTGKYVYIWLYTAADETSPDNFGVSTHQIIVPVEPRPDSLSPFGSSVVVSLDEDNHALIFDTK